MLDFLKHTSWALFDCVTGEWTDFERLPFEIGQDEGVDLRLRGAEVRDKHCAFIPGKHGRLTLVPRDEGAQVRLNGWPVTHEELETATDYSLQIGEHFLLLRGDRDLAGWRAALDHAAWSLHSGDGGPSFGPGSLLEICRRAKLGGLEAGAVAMPAGAGMGFYAEQLLSVFGDRIPEPPPVTPPELDRLPQAPALAPSGDDGALTCPVCWLHFNVGDVMHVAVHDSLRGDPILGEDAPLRFHATQFNDRGQALDAFRLPCPDLACPHCRRVLPPGFLDTEHHIFSIVGDQSAGKSYYLSVLAKLLPVALYRHFGVSFQDADPAGNAMLNDMKKALFSAQTPKEAQLVKTVLEGAMYERLPRYGRVVALPKPFVFNLSSVDRPECRCSTIFYDNAGEHFQPGRDSADSPGAQHVAKSAGILFLFDPFNNPDFRRRMNGGTDPQLQRAVLDQQDVILAELKVRVKKILNLRLHDRLDRPLAVLVGKCDAWMHWLGEHPFRDPVQPGRLDLAAIRHNSDQVRALMLDIAPTVVANAESISRRVLYFPVSSFGHPPVWVSDGAYAPDPRQLSPILVEAPVLWVLSHVKPELVPGEN